jgi:hypothetical protein
MQCSQKGRALEMECTVAQRLICKCCHKKTFILNVGAECKSEFNFCSLRQPGICLAVFNVPSFVLQKLFGRGKLFLLGVGVST